MRTLLRRAALGGVLLLAQAASGGFEEQIRSLALAPEEVPAAEAPQAPAEPAAAPAEADPWRALLAGNQRFAAGMAQGPHRGLKRRALLSKAQHPAAMVLACADSRVAPELLFDQGLGDLFVVRVAGNVAGPFDRASLEYGAEHLHIPLLVVLGHQSCGAVKAALESNGQGKGLSPDLQSLVEEIGPAVKGKDLAHLDDGVRENARLSAQRLLERSAVLREAVAAGHLRVVAARYGLEDGRVEALP